MVRTMIFHLILLLFIEEVFSSNSSDGSYAITFVDVKNNTYVLESSNNDDPLFIRSFNASLFSNNCNMTITEFGISNDTRYRPFYYTDFQCNETYTRIGILFTEEEFEDLNAALGNSTRGRNCISQTLYDVIGGIMKYEDKSYCYYTYWNQDRNYYYGGGDGYYYYYGGNNDDDDSINPGWIILMIGVCLMMFGSGTYFLTKK